MHRYTFEAPKIREWVEDFCKGKLVLNLFAGKTRIRGCMEVTVDLDKEMNPKYVMDALDCVKFLQRNMNENEKFDVIILDPPYSYRKSMEMYNGHRNSRFKQICDLLPDLLTASGKIITFGYHSIVMGKERGFNVAEICLISHGGAMRSTIASVEEMDKLDGDTIATVEERIDRVLEVKK